MDFYYEKQLQQQQQQQPNRQSSEAKVKVALVKKMDATLGASDADARSFHKYPPNSDELMLVVAQEMGLTGYGECYGAEHVTQVARHFGYKTILHDARDNGMGKQE